MGWTERYLGAVLKSIPEAKRADVERELGSSIADAVEERVLSGEDRTAAERAVLEGLGDPSLLASAYRGSPNYLIGPELFPTYRQFLPKLVAIVVPIASLATGAARVLAGGTYQDGIAAAIATAIQVAVQLAFWVTVTFVVLERAEDARQAKADLVEKSRRWSVERLPEVVTGRVSIGETVGEVLTAVITIGGLLLLRTFGTTDAGGATIPLLDPSLSNMWLPAFIVILGLQAVVHLVVYRVGHWTYLLASVFAALQVAFAGPVAWLALNGTLVNPAFATHVGYPPLAEGDAPVMLAIAVVSTIVTGWEVFDAFRKARNAQAMGAAVGIASLPMA